MLCIRLCQYPAHKIVRAVARRQSAQLLASATGRRLSATPRGGGGGSGRAPPGGRAAARAASSSRSSRWGGGGGRRGGSGFFRRGDSERAGSTGSMNGVEMRDLAELREHTHAPPSRRPQSPAMQQQRSTQQQRMAKEDSVLSLRGGDADHKLPVELV